MTAPGKTTDFTAVAIIAAHNEADIIGAVVGYLIDQGLSVYLLDHASTDSTARAVEPFLGKGLLAIEPFPGSRFPAARDFFAWSDILKRKQELSAELDADWFIHHDADEFRESPWEHLTLLEAIHRVDRLGYNAIDFELFNFWPTDELFRPGDDPRARFRFCESGRVWDKLQIKSWKKTAHPNDLVSSGGHEVTFPERRVFPVRFPLRHYPIRGQAHGTRKVFVDRQPRLLPEEVMRGWHVQYRDFAEGQRFIRASSTLVEYDGEAVRLSLVLGNRTAEARETLLVTYEAEIDRLTHELGTRRVETRRVQADLDTCGVQMRRLESEADARDEELREQSVAIKTLQAQLTSTQQLVQRLLADIEAQRRDLAALRTSKSWHWTAPLRWLQRTLSGR